MKLSEEILLQYADDRLGSDTRAEVETHLQQDDIASERLRLIKLSGDALAVGAQNLDDRGSEDPLAHLILDGDLDPQPATVTPLIQPQARTWPHWQKMAACLALIAIGFGSGLTLQKTVFTPGAVSTAAYPTWIVRVIDYHTLYGRETVSAARTQAGEVEGLEKRFSRIVGTQVTIPNLGARELDFRRGQNLAFEGQPIIQLAYLPEAKGLPVALCFKKTEEADAKPSYTAYHGMGVVRWRQKGIEYVLVGHRDKASLISDAESAFEQIAAGKRA